MARRYLDDDDPSAIRDLVDQALALPNIVSTPSRVLDRRTGRMAETTVYATREMIALEARMVEQARALRLTLTHAVEPAQVEAAMTAQEAELRQATDGRFGLSDEQREAIRSITDARGIAAMVGFAGSGKSTLLKAAQARGPPPAGASWAQRWPARRPRDWRRAPGSEAARWPRGNTPGRAAATDLPGDVFVIDEPG